MDDWGRRYSVDHPLHVYDGPTSASPVLGKFRGRTLPGAIFSSSNTLFVSFDSHYSNHYVNRKGFEIKYTALEFNYGKVLLNNLIKNSYTFINTVKRKVHSLL